MTDGRTTDTFIYYKLTFGSGELKKHNLCKGLCPKYVCQVSASSHMLSEKILFSNLPFVWPQQSMRVWMGGPKKSLIVEIFAP